MPRSQWSKGWECPACGLRRESEGGPDPCLGMLPGVAFACCGHGGKGDCKGYIYFVNGVRLAVSVTQADHYHNPDNIRSGYETRYKANRRRARYS